MKNAYTDKDLTETIKRKAYELWEKDGRRQGCDMHYWLKAEKVVRGQARR